MKKVIALILCILLCTGVCQARVGDVIGAAYHTDIVAYINHWAIPSYAVNGQSVIVAEDLNYCGFDVVWNNNTRSLSITTNTENWGYNMKVSKWQKSTDIRLWNQDRL